MIQYTNNDDKTSDETNDKVLTTDDKICLICLENNGILILCLKCRYKYCLDCANKVNNLCSVCIRAKKLYQNNYFDLNEYAYIYENMDDYGIENSHSTTYFFTLTMSIIINVIIGFCWIILIILFVFIGAKFIFNIFF
jgi:hypothetical protein